MEHQQILVVGKRDLALNSKPQRLMQLPQHSYLTATERRKKYDALFTAADRRKNKARGVSPGGGNGKEQAPEERKKSSHKDSYV